MRLLKQHTILGMANSYVIDSPSPSNLTYLWGFGSLLGLVLVMQIISGLTLAMHVRCDNRIMSSDSITLVPYSANRSSELGEGESPEPNLAFQPEAVVHDKPILVLAAARSFSYDETHTSRTIITTVLKLGEALVGNRCINTLEDCSAWSSIEGGITDFSTRIRKVIGFASKGDERTLFLSTGFPKGGNSYRQRNIGSTCFLGNRGYATGNSVGKGSNVALLSFRRFYVSGGDMEAKSNVSSKLNELANRSRSNPNQIIDREVFRLATSVETLIYAYENIKSKPGNMTPGVTPETLDGISKETFVKQSRSLRDESFSFSPSRRVQIPKASGGTRPLSVASPLDKIVQEAMRLVLEAIYEPLFDDSSHGFRPNRGCHTALKRVSQNFQPVQWVIEGDLAKLFDSISHHRLMQLIENKISDRRFTKLI